MWLWGMAHLDYKLIEQQQTTDAVGEWVDQFQEELQNINSTIPASIEWWLKFLEAYRGR
jgi:hypothetical protein